MQRRSNKAIKQDLSKMADAIYGISNAIRALDSIDNTGLWHGAVEPLRETRDWLMATAEAIRATLGEDDG